MKKDRELLELAAKALGYDTRDKINDERLNSSPPVLGLKIPGVSFCWNPLSLSNHALDMAVTLGLSFRNYRSEAIIEVVVWTLSGHRKVLDFPVDYDKPEVVSVRRALVIAASMIGSGKRSVSNE